MKAILIATLLSLALASAPFFRYTSPIKPISDEAPSSQISEYMTAFFAHFGLDQPTQALNCFNPANTILFFKHVYEVANLVADSEHRERINVHLDVLKLIIMHKALAPLKSCLSQTQDFANLMKKLNINNSNPDQAWIAKYIYYQADFGKLAGELPQVTGALNNKNYTSAGDLAAGVLNATVTDIQTQGLSLLGLKALWNGVHIGLGLPDAQSILSCWDNDTATVRLEFMYGMANAVASGQPQDAFTNTANFYNQTGNALIAQIPHSTWECWANCTDTQAESQALKIDLTSPQFHQDVANYVQNNQTAYWAFQQVMKVSLENHNFLHAGSAYAHFLQAVVA